MSAWVAVFIIVIIKVTQMKLILHTKILLNCCSNHLLVIKRKSERDIVHLYQVGMTTQRIAQDSKLKGYLRSGIELGETKESRKTLKHTLRHVRNKETLI